MNECHIARNKITRMVAALKSHLTDGSDVRSRRVKLQLGKGDTLFSFNAVFHDN